MNRKQLVTFTKHPDWFYHDMLMFTYDKCALFFCADFSAVYARSEASSYSVSKDNERHTIPSTQANTRDVGILETL